MINVVIPMSGSGRRFAEAGYKDPKPFIDVGGEPMITRVVNNLITMGDEQRFIFITRSEHNERLKSCFAPDAPYITFSTDTLTAGAACSCLLAESAIDNDDELIIANSDQIVGESYFMDDFLTFASYNNADGAIACFLNDDPKWSYARLRNGKIWDVAEKQVISNLATCGIYYYRRGRDFVEAAKSMIAKDIRTNGEYYVCPVYNEFLNLDPNRRVLPYMVNDFSGIGDPASLENYLTAHGYPESPKS